MGVGKYSPTVTEAYRQDREVNSKLIEDLRWKAKELAEGPTNISYSFTPAELEKFAELIIHECVAAIDTGNGEASSLAEHACSRRFQKDIMKHFGVE